MADGSVVFETKVDTEGFERGMERLRSAADTGLAGVEAGAKESGGAMSAAMEDAVAKMRKALTGSDWKAIGSAVANGVESGVKSGEASLLARMRSLAADMLRAVKVTLGIASPSAVFRDEVGAAVAQGIGVGAEQNLPEAFMGVEKALRSEQARLASGIEQRPSASAVSENEARGLDVSRIIEAIEKARPVAVISDGDIYEAYCRAQSAAGRRLGE